MVAMFQSMSKRLDAMERRLDVIEQRQIAFEERFSGLEQRQTRLEGLMEGIRDMLARAPLSQLQVPSTSAGESTRPRRDML